MTESVVQDQRRSVVRVAAYNYLRSMGEMARSMNHGDVIELIVFTGVWTINTQQLIGDPTRFAELKNIPPDSMRSAATLDEVQRLTAVPPDILATYIERLLEMNLVEQAPGGGYIVPGAVFAKPEMLDGANEVYTAMLGLVTSLRSVGFALGEEPAVKA